MENKPMSIAINELKEGIVTIVNNSGLPIYIAEMILKDILSDVTMVSNQVREKEYQEYVQAEQKKREEIKTQEVIDVEGKDVEKADK